eukprot:452774-Rhodomonas_salina.2
MLNGVPVAMLRNRNLTTARSDLLSLDIRGVLSRLQMHNTCVAISGFFLQTSTMQALRVDVHVGPAEAAVLSTLMEEREAWVGGGEGGEGGGGRGGGGEGGGGGAGGGGG